MVYGPTGNRVCLAAFVQNLNCKARNTPVDKTGVNFTDCSQGVLRTVDAPPLLSRLNRALELIRCCEKEPCEIQTRTSHTAKLQELGPSVLSRAFCTEMFCRFA